jgi:serine/threonine protein kinase
MMHEHGFIYRDLKPNNIGLVADSKGKQHIKLIDFGYAKFIKNNLTSSNCGAPLYKCPDVLV